MIPIEMKLKLLVKILFEYIILNDYPNKLCSCDLTKATIIKNNKENYAQRWWNYSFKLLVVLRFYNTMKLKLFVKILFEYIILNGYRNKLCSSDLTKATIIKNTTENYTQRCWNYSFKFLLPFQYIILKILVSRLMLQNPQLLSSKSLTRVVSASYLRKTPEYTPWKWDLNPNRFVYREW